MTERPGPTVVLGALTAEEKAAVLDRLTAADPSIETSAAEVAMSRLGAVSIDDIAVSVKEALRALDQDDLAARAGPTRYGYVEPTQAVWELLEEALEPWLEDIVRRAKLGLADAAITIAVGAMTALRNVEDCDHDELLLSWAPDFPAEGVEGVRDALRRAGIDPAEPRIQAALVGSP